MYEIVLFRESVSAFVATFFIIISDYPVYINIGIGTKSIS